MRPPARWARIADRRPGDVEPVAGGPSLVLRLVLRLVLCLGLGLALLLSPSSVGTTAADSPQLTLVGTARYDVVPAKVRVHVTVDLVATNRKPETVTTRYVFSQANLAVLPGTVNFRATVGGTKVSVGVVSSSARSTLLAIHFAKRLASGQSTAIHLTFDLPDRGGVPSRDVRVGDALATFPVWAFGTKGTPGSSVTVVFPSGYEVQVVAGKLGAPVTAADGTTTVASGPLGDPFGLSAYLVADRAGAFAETAVNVAVPGISSTGGTSGTGTVALAVRAWTDDAAWGTRTARLLRSGLPVIGAALGLAYPRTAPVVVEEATSHALDGNAGVLDTSTATLRIAYNANPRVILEEAARLWFEPDVFGDRWIVEGLASWAADKAATKLKLPAAPDASPPSNPSASPGQTVDGSDPAAALPLNAWQPSPNGADQASDAAGRSAATQLVDAIVGRTGSAGLGRVLQAAQGHQAAYQPAGPDPGAPVVRPDPSPTDWRGLLDLIAQRTGVDVTDLWRAWVVRPADAPLLDARTIARADLGRLISAAGDWAIPAAIRGDLEAWRFDAAATQIGEARSVLAARDDLAVSAALAGMTLPGELKANFEAGNLGAAAAEIRVARTIVSQIADARAESTAASVPLAQIGLVGQDPATELDGALAAFSAGDLEAAQARAIGAREAWAGAADLGGLRLRSAVASVLVVLLALFLITARLRRPGRRSGRGARSG